MFSRLFGRSAKERKEPTFEAAPVAGLPILVRRSIFEDADDGKIVSALIDDYVNPLMQRGCYLRGELPANAMRAYHTDYYLAQVANGGHGQFMHNSHMQPLVLKDIREGLAAIGIEPYASIFRDFEAFAASDSKRAAAVAGNSGFGTPDPVEAELNKRFYAGDCYKTLLPANGRWLKSLPEVKVVPDAGFAAAIDALIAANPQANARRIARERERIASLLQDTLQVAARLLAFEKGFLPVRIGGGDPSAKTPDGQSTIGWALNTPAGQFTMFVLEDAALLCEQYLADGRKVTPELMAQIRTALFAPNPDLDAVKGFDQKTWKEIARVPVALIEEAKAAAKNGDVLAAAEIACARLGDELVDLHALGKAGSGSWSFAIWGKAGQYMMGVEKAGMVVMKLPDTGASPIVIRLDDVRRHKAANEGGHA